MHEKKGVGGLQSVVRGIGQEKKAFAVGGGFGEPLWRGRGRGLFSGMLEVPQAIQTPQLSSALDCQLWSTRRTDAFAEQENGLLERCCAMQSRMQDAKCEESRGFRKGRKKGRAGPRPGSTECRYGYRYGHHSGLLRPAGAKAWGNFGVPAGLAPICAGACWSQPATSEKGPGNCR